MAAVDVASAGALTTAIPDQFNVATYFVDRNVDEGRGDNTAIECLRRRADRITYRQVLERVNRVGNALRDVLDVRLEERVLLLLLDCPEFAYSFFGAMKIGAVPVPTNTLFKPPDYEYILNDSRARVAIVSEALLPQLQAIPTANLRYLREVVVVGDAPSGTRSFASLLEAGSAELEAEPTSKDDAAFWLYSSGSTGFPKGCVHLHHDMLVCTDLYGRGVLGITERDRCFSVAKLFFAYGLGNGLYFPFGVGATSDPVVGPANACRTSSPSSTVIARRCSSRCRPTTRSCWLRSRRRTSASVRLAVSAGEALPPALFERFQGPLRRDDPGWHRLDRDLPHLHLQPARRDQARLVGQARRRATRRACSTTTASRCRRARSATC